MINVYAVENHFGKLLGARAKEFDLNYQVDASRPSTHVTVWHRPTGQSRSFTLQQDELRSMPAHHVEDFVTRKILDCASQMLNANQNRLTPVGRAVWVTVVEPDGESWQTQIPENQLGEPLKAKGAKVIDEGRKRPGGETLPWVALNADPMHTEVYTYEGFQLAMGNDRYWVYVRKS